MCVKCAKVIFLSLLHFIPSYYPKTKQKKKSIVSPPRSPPAALRCVFASFCAFCLPVPLQLERFGHCRRLEGVRSGAGRMRRGGGGGGRGGGGVRGGGDRWVGGPELQAAKVLNPGTLWRRWRRLRRRRRHGDGW